MIDHTIRTQDNRPTWQLKRALRDFGGSPKVSVGHWRPSLLWRIKHWWMRRVCGMTFHRSLVTKRNYRIISLTKWRRKRGIRT